MTETEFLSRKLQLLLRLRRKPVGVKLAYSEDDYLAIEAVELKKPLEYCVAVKSAGLGYSLKLTAACSRCPGSTRALGFSPAGEDFYSGESGCGLGLFRDRETAAGVCEKMSILTRPLYGVMVKPLEKYSECTPDAVIVIASPREMMRLIQGSTCAYGMLKDIRPTGNQAICVECTAQPILTQEISISLLCSGTRYLAGWEEGEMGAGIPYSRLPGLVQGIHDTVNGTELDSRKEEIRAGLNSLGVENDGITMDTAYYLGTRAVRRKA